MGKTPRQNISSTDLIRVLKEVARLYYEKKTETTGSYDFDRATPFLREEGLDKNIIGQRSDKGIGRGFPINSEKSIYSWINNIVVRNLSVDIDSSAVGKELTEWESTSAMLHLENCRFEKSGSNLPTLVFPWTGAFRFYRNEFEYVDKPGIDNWLFVFGHNSTVTFVENRFRLCSVQINSASVEPPGPVVGLDRLSFMGNKRIGELHMNCHSKYYEFSGINCIGKLDLWGHLTDNGREHEFSFYFGPREKIDPGFHYNRHHRKLFLSLREHANKKQDLQVVRTLERYLDRVEYSLIRNQGIRLKDGIFVWLEYWQDRALHAWRRYTSDFYRSWSRPLGAIFLGYLALNAVPWLVIDGFSCADYMSFSLRPINKIPFYTEGLSDMYESRYACLSDYSKNILSFVGIFQTLWLAVWGIALRKTISR